MFAGNSIVAMLIIGLSAGIIGGMFGVGGGLIIVPALVIIVGLDQKIATGTSLFALLLPTGLLAVLDYYERGDIRLKYGLWIAPGLLVGGLVGAKITRGMSDMTLKRIYAVFLLVVAAYYLVISTESGRALIRPRPVAKPVAEIGPTVEEHAR